MKSALVIALLLVVHCGLYIYFDVKLKLTPENVPANAPKFSRFDWEVARNLSLFLGVTIPAILLVRFLTYHIMTALTSALGSVSQFFVDRAKRLEDELRVRELNKKVPEPFGYRDNPKERPYVHERTFPELRDLVRKLDGKAAATHHDR